MTLRSSLAVVGVAVNMKVDIQSRRFCLMKTFGKSASEIHHRKQLSFAIVFIILVVSTSLLFTNSFFCFPLNESRTRFMVNFSSLFVNSPWEISQIPLRRLSRRRSFHAIFKYQQVSQQRSSSAREWARMSASQLSEKLGKFITISREARSEKLLLLIPRNEMYVQQF